MSEITRTLGLEPAKVRIVPQQQHLSMAGIGGLLRVVGLFVFSAVIVAWRRPDQIAAPILWFEEGTDILVHYADCGLCALFPSINGNIAFSAKILLLPVFKVSVLSAPAMAAIVGMLFGAAVICAIATSPTHLKAKYLCAIATLLVPTAPENYGVLLYSVWWSGLLIALALLWDTSRGLHWLRLTFLIIGGLSTPFVIVAAPLFVVRAYREPTATEIAVVLTACLLAFIAALATKSVPPTQPFDASLNIGAAFFTLSKFFGLFIAPLAKSGLATKGGLLIIAIASLAYHERRKLDFYFFLLAALLVASIAANLIRAPIADINPFGSGPRYFFLPYIFISFMLLWLWSLINPMASLLKAAPLMLIVVAIFGGMQQTFFIHPVQERRSWSEAMLKCANTQGETVLPLGYHWTISIPQDKCRALIDGSLIK